MQKLGKRSLSSVLKVVVEVASVLWVGAAVLILGSAVLALAFPAGRAAQLTVVLPAGGLSFFKEAIAAKVSVVEAIVTVQPASAALAFGQLGAMTTMLACQGALLFNLRRIMRSLTAGQPFAAANGARLRTIGIFFLAGELVEYLWKMAGHWYLTSAAQFTTGSPFKPWPDFDELFIGLIVLVIAEVAHRGAIMEQERALTV